MWLRFDKTLQYFFAAIGNFTKGLCLISPWGAKVEYKHFATTEPLLHQVVLFNIQKF